MCDIIFVGTAGNSLACICGSASTYDGVVMVSCTTSADCSLREHLRCLNKWWCPFVMHMGAQEFHLPLDGLDLDNTWPSFTMYIPSEKL